MAQYEIPVGSEKFFTYYLCHQDVFVALRHPQPSVSTEPLQCEKYPTFYELGILTNKPDFVSRFYPVILLLTLFVTLSFGCPPFWLIRFDAKI